MFKHMPFILVLVIVAVILVNPFLPLSVKEVLYAISLTIKAGIIFILPFIIFSLLFKTMAHLAGRATFVIAVILVCVMTSNFVSTFLSHYIGEFIYRIHFNIIQPKSLGALTPAWTTAFPKLIDNNVAMFSGIILGILLGSLNARFANFIAVKLDKITTYILASFKFFIPVFVLGFMVKLAYDGIIGVIIKDYAVIFAIIALAQFSYITFAYLALNRFNFSKALLALQNIFPAGVAGFSTMSSAAVMPLTIEGAASNARNKELARAVVPATVNIHLVGDCIAIPVFAYALMKSFGLPAPALITYLTFTCYFVLAKFSVAAVPGGGIIVMLPILEAYLGFTPEMLSLITALYVLFDPVITSANVFGNGAFAKLIDCLMGSQKSQQALSEPFAQTGDISIPS